MRSLIVTVLALSTTLVFGGDRSGALKHINAAGEVFSEIMNTPDKGIPQEILEKAQCVGIIPGLKRVGFIVGAKYGKGIMVCRTANGSWSAPSIMRVEGGSFGFQIGAGETDLVMVVQNKSGERKLMEDKFTLGADASVMGGPVGRSAQAETDAQLHAEILSWSRSRGLFAGIALDGSTLRPDKDDNMALYGAGATQHEILEGGVRPPADAQSLYAALNRHTSAHEADRERH
jgi:lipid-binding SYLF domain-containing protein